MGILEVAGLVVLILLVALVIIFLRREIIFRRGGTVEMNVRLSTFVPERGWAPGLGRFVGDELRWYRLFSFGIRPRKVLSRRGLVVEERRQPTGAERLAMPEGWVIIRCRSANGTSIELALAASALTGFLSWVEAAPPGALHPI